jgi:cobalt-zinc-cadmium efflux system outer membrane protein
MAQLDRDVRGAYWSARASREASALAAAEAMEADSLAAIAGARFRAGEISLLEQEQAEQEAALTRQAESRAREDARVSALDLARALGEPDGTMVPTDPLDSGLDRLPPGDLLPAATPAVRSAVADSVSAAAQLRATARARVPIPSLQAGAEWGDPSQPGSLSTLGFAIPLPLWNQGGGAMTDARARSTRASALAAETRLEADRLIRGAKVHLAETALRARVARDSLVPSAARIRSRAMRGYAAGETGILPALDALRNERQILLQAVQDQLAFQLALADWHALTGSGE